MSWRFTLWAFVLGFAGGWTGLYLANEVRPDLDTAPGYGMIVGAVVGAALGCALVYFTHPRKAGD